MAVSYYGTDLFSRVLPGLRQYEATTGRRVSPQVIQGLIQGQLETEAQRSLAGEGLALRREELAAERKFREEQLKREAQAATVSGITQTATSAATLGLLYKGGFFSKAPAVLPSTLPSVTEGLPATLSVPTAVNLPGTGATAVSTGLPTISQGLLPAGVGFGVGYGAGRLFRNSSGAVQRRAGAISGALAGAAVGSVVPGVGTALGFVIGGVSGYFGGKTGAKK